VWTSQRFMFMHSYIDGCKYVFTLSLFSLISLYYSTSKNKNRKGDCWFNMWNIDVLPASRTSSPTSFGVPKQAPLHSWYAPFYPVRNPYFEAFILYSNLIKLSIYTFVSCFLNMFSCKLWFWVRPPKWRNKSNPIA